MANPNELALVDLSSIAYPFYMTSTGQPDPDWTSHQIVARVRALTQNHPHAAVCCDSGRSFRHDAVASYKANRPEREERLHHQIRLAKERLEADGYPVWGVRGFEADDVIASGVAKAMAMDEDVTVLVVSTDKDLLQLVGPRVRAMSARDGSIFDAEAVFAKYGVTPEQMCDYLTLVGDASDNVKGAEKIGEVKARQLLALFGTLDAVYAAIDDGSIRTQPSILKSLTDFRPRLAETRHLITLRTDVELPFHEIAAERVAKESASFMEGYAMADESTTTEQPEESDQSPAQNEAAPEPPASTAAPAPPASAPSTQLALVQTPAVLPAVPVEWERQLDPRSPGDARLLAQDMFASHMFSAYGTPQGVLSTIMVGRELGLPAMSSLRSIHNIEGKHSLSAQLMVALILKSGLAEFFEPVDFDDKKAAFETHRRGARRPVTLVHTIEMARQAWPKSKKDWEQAFEASGWGRNPTDMLVARATSRLARMVYPDLMAGLYTPEELEEIRLSKVA